MQGAVDQLTAHLHIFDVACFHGQLGIIQGADVRHDLHLCVWLLQGPPPTDGPCQGCAAAPAPRATAPISATPTIITVTLLLINNANNNKIYCLHVPAHDTDTSYNKSEYVLCQLMMMVLMKIMDVYFSS